MDTEKNKESHSPKYRKHCSCSCLSWQLSSCVSCVQFPQCSDFKDTFLITISVHACFPMSSSFLLNCPSLLPSSCPPLLSAQFFRFPFLLKWHHFLPILVPTDSALTCVLWVCAYVLPSCLLFASVYIDWMFHECVITKFLRLAKRPGIL